MTKRHLHFD